MAKALAIFSFITLFIVLGSTVYAIWTEMAQKDDLLTLTELLLSWEVIAGGLAIGTGTTFNTEIKSWLTK